MDPKLAAGRARASRAATAQVARAEAALNPQRVWAAEAAVWSPPRARAARSGGAALARCPHPRGRRRSFSRPRRPSRCPWGHPAGRRGSAAAPSPSGSACGPDWSRHRRRQRAVPAASATAAEVEAIPAPSRSGEVRLALERNQVPVGTHQAEVGSRLGGPRCRTALLRRRVAAAGSRTVATARCRRARPGAQAAPCSVKEAAEATAAWPNQRHHSRGRGELAAEACSTLRVAVAAADCSPRTRRTDWAPLRSDPTGTEGAP